MKTTLSSEIAVLVMFAFSALAFGDSRDQTREKDRQDAAESAPQAQEGNIENIDSYIDPYYQATPDVATAMVSFSESVSGDLRRKGGLSVGTAGIYDSNVFEDGSSNPSDVFTLFEARVFKNALTPRSEFHMDYRAGYRLYQNATTLDDLEHEAVVFYRYRQSPRLGFSFGNDISRLPNDNLTGTNSPITRRIRNRNFHNNVIFSREPVLRNGFHAGMDYRLTRQSGIGLEFNHRYIDYTDQPDRATKNESRIEIDYRYSMNEWVTLRNNYRIAFDHYNDEALRNRLHRLELLGLDYMIPFSPTWTIFAAGGMDFAEQNSNVRSTATVRAGVMRKSPSTNLVFEYQRGFRPVNGTRSTLRTNLVTAYFVQRLSRRLNFRVVSAFEQGRALFESGELRTWSGGTGFEFALHPNLVVNANAGYVSQRGDVLTDLPQISRYVVYAGLQYLFPRPRRGRRETVAPAPSLP